MIQIHKIRGVPFKLTIPLNEIRNTRVSITHVPADRVSDYVIANRIQTWAKEKFAQKKTTIKYCQYWRATEFDNGQTKVVLFIEGHIYGGCSGQDVSDTEAEKALDDFEGYIKMGE